MEKKPYVQLNYVVTLCLCSGVRDHIITDNLSIDSKNYPNLLLIKKRNNLAFIAICLQDAAKKWYNSDEVAIINFWLNDIDTASIDEDGNVIFD